MKQSQRCKRLAELIRRQLGLSFLYYRDHPLLSQVTITGVEVAADLSIAKVFFSVLDEKNLKPVLQELQREGGHLRHSLAKELNLRITPRLHFVYDVSIVHGQKLSAIIDAAIAEDEKK